MITLAAAKSDNNVIGDNNQLMWHLSDDLRRFKLLTSGHPVIMGRVTFDSVGKPLPNRTNIVITRNKDWTSEGVEVAHSLKKAIDRAKEIDTEIFIIGGGKIYEQSMDVADAIEVTEVHHTFEGDTLFPEIDLNVWKEVSRENHKKDERNEYDYSFVRYEKK